jgi:hypothetical protein
VVNTPPAIPNVPAGISVPVGNGRSYAVTWQPSPAGGAAVNHYTLREVSGVPPSTTTIDLNMALATSKSYTKPNASGQFAYSVRACATADESACSAFTGTVVKFVCPTTGCE